MRVVKEFGFEGIVAKRKDSFYESGKRTGAWVKYRVNKSQEFVIGGSHMAIRWTRWWSGTIKTGNYSMPQGKERLRASSSA
jgi:hypothetical protein